MGLTYFKLLSLVRDLFLMQLASVPDVGEKDQRRLAVLIVAVYLTYFWGACHGLIDELSQRASLLITLRSYQI